MVATSHSLVYGAWIGIEGCGFFLKKKWGKKKGEHKRVVGSILSPLGWHDWQEETGWHALVVATRHSLTWVFIGRNRSAHGQTLLVWMMFSLCGSQSVWVLLEGLSTWRVTSHGLWIRNRQAESEWHALVVAVSYFPTGAIYVGVTYAVWSGTVILRLLLKCFLWM